VVGSAGRHFVAPGNGQLLWGSRVDGGACRTAWID